MANQRRSRKKKSMPLFVRLFLAIAKSIENLFWLTVGAVLFLSPAWVICLMLYLSIGQP